MSVTTAAQHMSTTDLWIEIGIAAFIILVWTALFWIMVYLYQKELNKK